MGFFGLLFMRVNYWKKNEIGDVKYKFKYFFNDM